LIRKDSNWIAYLMSFQGLFAEIYGEFI